MPTVVTFKWQGWRPIYTARHVNAFARMIKGACHAAPRIVCVTDDPKGITDCETFPLWEAPKVAQVRLQNCYLRLRLFDAAFSRRFGERIVCMDLDAVILQDLAPLFVGQEPFRAIAGESAPINGSIWALQVGQNEHVWRIFAANPQRAASWIEAATHSGRKLTGSDQAWMSLMLPDVPTWGPADGVYQFSRLKTGKTENARVIFFAGAAKPWTLECKEKSEQLYNVYRAFALR